MQENFICIHISKKCPNTNITDVKIANNTLFLLGEIGPVQNQRLRQKILWHKLASISSGIDLVDKSTKINNKSKTSSKQA